MGMRKGGGEDEVWERDLFVNEETVSGFAAVCWLALASTSSVLSDFFLSWPRTDTHSLRRSSLGPAKLKRMRFIRDSRRRLSGQAIFIGTARNNLSPLLPRSSFHLGGRILYGNHSMGL